MVGEQCSQQGLPARWQFGDEVPQRLRGVGVKDPLLGAHRRVGDRF